MSRLDTQQQDGFSMIEVLVTLLVLSIGLLGLAGLQGLSLTTNNTAYQSSLATTLAGDIVNRMRANRGAALARQYHQSSAGNLSNAEQTCGTTGCGAAAMASNDLFSWDMALANGLPNGRGVVCVHSTPNAIGTLLDPDNPQCDGNGTTYAIKVWWGQLDGNGIPTFSFATSHEP